MGLRIFILNILYIDVKTKTHPLHPVYPVHPGKFAA